MKKNNVYELFRPNTSQAQEDVYDSFTGQIRLGYSGNGELLGTIPIGAGIWRDWGYTPAFLMTGDTWRIEVTYKGVTVGAEIVSAEDNYSTHYATTAVFDAICALEGSPYRRRMHEGLDPGVNTLGLELLDHSTADGTDFTFTVLHNAVNKTSEYVTFQFFGIENIDVYAGPPIEGAIAAWNGDGDLAGNLNGTTPEMHSYIFASSFKGNPLNMYLVTYYNQLQETDTNNSIGITYIKEKSRLTYLGEEYIKVLSAEASALLGSNYIIDCPEEYDNRFVPDFSTEYCGIPLTGFTYVDSVSPETGISKRVYTFDQPHGLPQLMGGFGIACTYRSDMTGSMNYGPKGVSSIELCCYVTGPNEITEYFPVPGTFNNGEDTIIFQPIIIRKGSGMKLNNSSHYRKYRIEFNLNDPPVNMEW